MKKLITLTAILFVHVFVFGQTENTKEEGKKEIIDSYKFFFTDLAIDAKIDYTMTLDDKSNPININEEKISPFFAIFLFKQQKNRFEYRKKIFYWNDVAIPLKHQDIEPVTDDRKLIATKYRHIKPVSEDKLPLLKVTDLSTSKTVYKDVNGVTILSSKAEILEIHNIPDNDKFSYLIFSRNGKKYKLIYNYKNYKWNWYKL